MTIRDQVLLYCCMIYEPENEKILSFLPQERADLLQKEARRFDRFPKEVRITLVSKLLGYLVQHIRNTYLERIHPSWVAESLKEENPKIVALIISRLSQPYRTQVLGYLDKQIPSGTAASTPVAETVFQIFSNRFVSMAAPWGEKQLSIETLYLLKEEEILIFLRHIGVREIARALVLAGKDVLTALITRFPADLQQDFVKGIKSATADSTEKQRIATKRLSKYDFGSMPLEEAALKTGLTKVGAVLHNKEEVLRKIAQRLPAKVGMVLLEAAKETEVVEDEEEELKNAIPELIEREKIDKSLVESLFPADVRSRPSSIN